MHEDFCAGGHFWRCLELQSPIAGLPCKPSQVLSLGGGREFWKHSPSSASMQTAESVRPSHMLVCETDGFGTVQIAPVSCRLVARILQRCRSPGIYQKMATC